MREFLEMVGVQWESLEWYFQTPIAAATLAIALFGAPRSGKYLAQGSWATAKGLWAAGAWWVDTVCEAPAKTLAWWTRPRIDPHVQMMNAVNLLQSKLDSLDREIRGS